MSLTTLTPADLYAEIADLARDQGINSKEQWDELVDDVVEDHLDLGELDLEEDSEGIKDDLRGKWPVYKKETADDDKEDDLLDEEEEPARDDEGDDLFASDEDDI